MRALASLPTLVQDPTVSFVIPALNEEPYIGALLDSIEAQTYPSHRIEVIVADGGSTDATRAIVSSRIAASRLRAVRLIDNPTRSTASGLNAGASIATGDIVVVLGAHTVLDCDFTTANVVALRHSGAAATGGPIETVGAGSVATAIAAAMSHPFGVGNARFRYATQAGDVDTIAFAAYRREVFEALGGFDLAREKAEDAEFNYRLRREGGRLYLTPDIRCRYFCRASFAGLWRQYAGYGSAKGRMIVDDPGAVRLRHVVPLATVVAGSALGVLATVSKAARTGWSLLVIAYGASAVVSARRASARHGARWWMTAFAFVVMHASYSTGMVLGILRSARGVDRAP